MIRSCVVHREHQDEPESFDYHHVVPVAWHPATTYVITVCPNAHRDIHVALDALVAGEGEFPKGLNVRRFPAKVLLYALQGYHMATEQGLTPRRTL